MSKYSSQRSPLIQFSSPFYQTELMALMKQCSRRYSSLSSAARQLLIEPLSTTVWIVLITAAIGGILAVSVTEHFFGYRNQLNELAKRDNETNRCCYDDDNNDHVMSAVKMTSSALTMQKQEKAVIGIRRILSEYSKMATEGSTLPVLCYLSLYLWMSV